MVVRTYCQITIVAKDKNGSIQAATYDNIICCGNDNDCLVINIATSGYRDIVI